MSTIAQVFINCFNNGHKVIAVGCGGSSSEASHFVAELLCKVRRERRALPAITLIDPSVITAISNDMGFGYIFSRQIEALGNKGDVLLTFSTSGKSPSVLNAIHTAKNKKMKVIECPRIGDTTQHIQEFQMSWTHAICEEIEDHIC